MFIMRRASAECAASHGEALLWQHRGRYQDACLLRDETSQRSRYTGEKDGIASSEAALFFFGDGRGVLLIVDGGDCC